MIILPFPVEFHKIEEELMVLSTLLLPRQFPLNLLGIIAFTFTWLVQGFFMYLLFRNDIKFN